MEKRDLYRRIAQILWGGWQLYGFLSWIGGGLMGNFISFLYVPFAQDWPILLKILYSAGLFVVALILSVVFIRLLQLLFKPSEKSSSPQIISKSPRAQQASHVGGDNIQVSGDLIQNFNYGGIFPKEERKVNADEKQQPYVHVESHDQRGGITAYQVNIQPGDRQLSDDAAKQLEDYLKGVSFKSVEVNAVMGDGEAFRFASQIKNFLTSKGFDVKGVNQVVYSAPVQGQAIEPPNDAGVVKVIIGNR